MQELWDGVDGVSSHAGRRGTQYAMLDPIPPELNCKGVLVDRVLRLDCLFSDRKITTCGSAQVI